MKRTKQQQIKPKQFIPKIFLKKIPRISRNKIITQKMIGRFYKVHNGKTFLLIAATNLKLGTKIGEYVLTKKSCIHKKKKKRKKR